MVQADDRRTMLEGRGWPGSAASQADVPAEGLLYFLVSIDSADCSFLARSSQLYRVYLTRDRKLFRDKNAFYGRGAR